MSKIKKLAFGVSWGAFSTIAVTGFQLVFMAIMARFLDPASFGLVAIANVSLRFFSFFAQMGTGPALIQKPTLQEGDIAAALSVSLGISFLFFGLAQVSAPFLESFYQMPELGAVIRALSINFVISGFSAISVGLMQRNTAFRGLAIIEVISYVFGYGVVGLTAAYHDMEVWALVAAFMTQTLLTAVLSYSQIRFPLRFRHSPAQRRHFLQYGGRYSFIGFTEFLSASLDALVIGKMLGATPAGFYNRASLLANLPVQQPANILTKALFPIMSSVGNQRDKQIIGLQLSSLLVGSYAFAVSSGIYIAAADIVKVLLGNKWLDSIPILEMLSMAVGPAYISHVAGVTLDSLNKLRTKLQIQLSMLILIIILLLLVAPSGKVLDIAAAVVVMEWMRMSIMAIKLTHILRMPIRDSIIIMLFMAIVAISTSLMIVLTSELISPDFTSVFRLCAEIVAGAIGLLLGFLISRYLAVYLPAIHFLAERSPIFAKLFPKFA